MKGKKDIPSDPSYKNCLKEEINSIAEYINENKIDHNENNEKSEMCEEEDYNNELEIYL